MLYTHLFEKNEEKAIVLKVYMLVCIYFVIFVYQIASISCLYFILLYRVVQTRESSCFHNSTGCRSTLSCDTPRLGAMNVFVECASNMPPSAE